MIAFQRVINVSLLLVCATLGMRAMENTDIPDPIKILPIDQREELVAEYIEYLKKTNNSHLWFKGPIPKGGNLSKNFEIVSEKPGDHRNIYTHYDKNNKNKRRSIIFAKKTLTSFAKTQRNKEKILALIMQYAITKHPKQFEKLATAKMIEYHQLQQQKQEHQQQLLPQQKNIERLQKIVAYLQLTSSPKLWLAGDTPNDYRITTESQGVLRRIAQYKTNYNSQRRCAYIGKYSLQSFAKKQELSHGTVNEKEKIIELILQYMAENPNDAAPCNSCDFDKLFDWDPPLTPDWYCE